MVNIAIWAKLFNLFEVNKTIKFYLLLSLSFMNFPLWQINFNYQIFTQVSCALLAVVLLTREPGKASTLIFFALNILVIPFGHNFYITLVVYYVEILTLFVFLRGLNFRLKITHLNYIWLFIPVLYFAFGTISFYYEIVNNEYRLTSPGGRDESGKVDFQTFLNYGDQHGLNKFVSIFGQAIVNTRDVSIYISVFFLALILLFISKSYKLLESDHKKILVIIGIILVSTYPISPLAYLIFHLPGVEYVRHLSYFFVVAKPFMLLLFGIILTKSNPSILKHTIQLTLFFFTIALLNNRTLANVGITTFLVVLYALSNRYLKRRNFKFKKPLSKIAYISIGLSVLLSNQFLYFAGNELSIYRSPMITKYEKTELFNLSVNANDSLTKEYIDLAQKSESAQYTFASVVLKRKYCDNMNKLNGQFRSDFESQFLVDEYEKIVALCRKGGARFWEYDGNLLRNAKATFNRQIRYSGTTLNYEILQFDPNKRYYVELDELNWKYRNYFSSELLSVASDDICKSCISMTLDSQKGTVFFAPDPFINRVSQNLYLCIVLTSIVVVCLILLERFKRRRMTL
jgi:hypothetical protein